jgi:hypothetical protein
MLFHPQKCSVVHLTRCRQILHFDYQLHSHILQTESQVKYLGVTISNDLRWSHHINNISATANRTSGFLRRNIKLNCTSIKESAYEALVRPLLEYASPVWDPYTKEDIITIEKVQRRAARWV